VLHLFIILRYILVFVFDDSMKGIKILYFFPYPIVNRNHGNVTRAIQFLQYFEARKNHISVDFVTEEHNYVTDEKEKMELLFPGLRTFFLQRKHDKSNYLRYLIKGKIPHIINKRQQKKFHTHIPSEVTHRARQQFDEILKANSYDVIIISYVFWASLIRNNPYIGKAKLVMDTHDLMTGQYKSREGFRLGATFEEEMNILNEFHETWSISTDELYLFSQFAPKSKHFFVPVMFEKKPVAVSEDKPYDLIYVASDNPCNQKSAKWFFEKVYPLLPQHLKICVIGGIVKFIPDLPNVHKVFFAETLDTYYQQSKIAICPMLEGTGVKVKVVEAFSFGLPVVCTLRGLDGLPAKKHNGCLMAADEAAFVKHILNLLEDATLYNRVREEGIAMIEKYFDKESVYRELDEILGIA
jgi:Glycosyltransferase